MSRSKHKKNTGRFAGIPNPVVNSQAYKSLKGNSAKLLTILAYQYNSYNNGDLVITQSKVSEWITKNTMYSARDELYEKGFIVINAFGGRSGGGRKLPSLYAITWKPIDLLEERNGEIRFSHYCANQPPLNYWMESHNPDYKTKADRDSQYKKDIKKIKKTFTKY